ncbi:MAG: hypothetical protein HQM15_03170 [Deltaproteobacteria bacterium]|nr:hypothetical protein [Deltaproteobacteria bacterium]
MKKTFTIRSFTSSGFLVLAFFFFLGSSPAQATVKFWRGEINSNFSTAGNWSTSSNSMVATTVPDVNDVATYNSNGNVDCNLDVTVNVAGINLLAGYKKNITQNAGIIVTIGASHYSQSDGIFTGGESGITDNGNFTLNGGRFISTSETFTVAGNWDTQTPAAGSFAHNGGTVKFANTIDKIINVNGTETFNNFILAASSTAALLASSNDVLKTVGTLSLSSGYAVLSGSSTFEAQGDVIIGANYSSANTQPLLFSGTNNQTLDATGASSAFHGNMTINKVDGRGVSTGSVSLFSNLTLSSGKTLTVLKGTLDNNGKTLTAGNVVYNSDTPLALTGVFNVLNDYTQAAGTVSLGSFNDTFSGKFTLTGGSFISSTGTLSVAGNWDTHSAAAGSFVHNNGTVKLAINGNRSINVNGTETFNHLTVAATSAWTLTETSGINLKVLGILTLNSGAFIQAGASKLEAQGDVVLGAGYSSANTQALLLSGTADQTLSAALDPTVFNADILVNKASGTVTLGSALVLDAAGQNLMINSGTFALAGNNLTVNGIGGTLAVASGATLQLNGLESISTNANSPSLAAGSLVKYVGSSNYTIKNYPYSKLTIAGGAALLPGDLSIGSALTLQAGTLDANGHKLTVLGDWINTGGAFTASGGTVDLGTASQSISGSNTFYNLTKSVSSAATLTFANGSTQTVSNNLSLNGAAGQKLLLKSETPALQWNINSQSARSISYLDVKNSNNISSATLNCWTGCSDSGNNSHWSFSPASVTLSSTSVAVSEGGSTGSYNVSLASSPSSVVTITASSSDTNYGVTVSPATLTFTAANWSTPQTVKVTAVDDNLYEGPHSATISHSASSSDASYNGISISSVSASITDNDLQPSISINSPSVVEGNSGASNLAFTVSLSNPSTQTITVNYASSDGSATAGSDYTATSGTLTFSSGQISQTINVSVNGDYVAEADETVTMTLSGATNATIIGSTGIGTIINDDTARVTITESGGSTHVTEGGATDSYTLVLTSQPTSSVTLTASSSDTTYGVTVSPSSLTFTIANWNIPQTVTVTAVDDNKYEGPHLATISHSASSNDSYYNAIPLASVTAHITDNDSQPSISIDNPSVSEGNSGTTPLTFTVSLSNLSTQDVSVYYATADGTATAGSDYSAAHGTLTFAAGETSKTIQVSVNGDTTVEPDETFHVNLSSPVNASLSKSQGLGTILNDDHAPVLANPGAKSVAENSSLAFTLSATDADGDAISYACLSSCPSGLSVNSSSGAVSWTPTFSQSGVYPSVTFQASDGVNTSTEAITITVNDTQGRLTSSHVDPATLIVGASGTATIRFTNTNVIPLDGKVLVVFPSGFDVSAASGASCNMDGVFATAVSGQTVSITRSAGSIQTAAAAEICTIDHIRNPQVGGLTGTYAIKTTDSLGSMIDEDPAVAANTITQPSLSIDNPSVLEGNSGTTALNFTLSLSVASGVNTTVNYATADGTATAGSDYMPTSGTLTFAPGETSKTIQVSVNGDRLLEPDETLTMTLSGATNATISTSSGTGTILNDDHAPVLTNPGAKSVAENVALNFSLSATDADGDPLTYSCTANCPTGLSVEAGTGAVSWTPTYSQAATYSNVTFQVSDGVNTDTQSITLTVNETQGNLTNTKVEPASLMIGMKGNLTVGFTTANPWPADGKLVIDLPAGFDAANASLLSKNITGSFNAPLLSSGKGTNDIITLSRDGSGAVLPGGTAVTLVLSGVRNPTSSGATGTSWVKTEDSAASLIDQDSAVSGTTIITPSLSIDNPSMLEGNSGTTPLLFTVTLSAASGVSTTVDYATADGTATAGSDYIAASGTLTIPAGQISQTIPVNIIGDTIDEPDETLRLNLSNPVNASISGSSYGTGTLLNDDSPPTLSITDVSQPEGNAGTSNMGFMVTLSAMSGKSVSVNYATADNTATAGSNYSSLSGVLSFNPGESSKTINVSILGDKKVEPDEIFFVNLWGASNATISRSQALGNILNDDHAPVLTNPGAKSVAENVALNFSLSATDADGDPLTYSCTANCPTGLSVEAGTGAVSWTPTYSQAATYSNVTFQVSDGVNTDTQSITLTVNETQGSLTNTKVEPASLVAGARGAVTVNFTNANPIPVDGKIKVLFPAGFDVSAATNGSCSGIDGSFTTSVSGQMLTLTRSTGLISSLGAQSCFIENIRNPQVSGPTGVYILQTTDNSDAVIDSDANVSATTILPGSLTNTQVEPASLMIGMEGNITVSFTTANPWPTNGKLVIDLPAGFDAAKASLVSKNITGSFNAPLLSSGDGMNDIITLSRDGTGGVLTGGTAVTIVLSGVRNPTSSGATGTFSIKTEDNAAHIIDQDKAVSGATMIRPSLSIDNPSVLEGNSGTTPLLFTVTLSAASGVSTTVDYATADGTATAGSDYTATSGTLLIPAGQISQTIQVSIRGDTTDEPDESFTLNLSNPVNADISGLAYGIGTILNDDTAPTLSIADASQAEGNSGSSNMGFTLTLSEASAKTVSVNYATADGTALAGSDYNSTSGVLVFNPGETTKTLYVPILGDTTDEPDEFFTVNLSGASNATISRSQALGTILNDDSAPSISINDVSQTEGNSGSSNMSFTVTLSAVSGKTVSVNYETADNTATAGSDYISTSGTLLFNPGENSKTLNVSILGDAKVEMDETFYVHLSSPVNASLGKSQGLGTILNDDHAPLLADPGNKTIKSGSSLAFTLNAVDADADPITYSCVSNCPTGLSVDSSSGAVAWMPTASQKGLFSKVTFKAEDPAANESTRSINITVTGVSIVQTGGSTDVTEGGSTDTYTVILDSEPLAAVTVNIATDSQVSVAPSSLVFTAENWKVPQTVTVTAVDDAVQEGLHTGLVQQSVTSADPNYNGIAAASVKANITDNDQAGLSLIESGGSTQVTEGGTTDSYGVVLTSQPTGPVAVSLVPIDATNRLKLTSSNLTFTPDNWNIPQSITVTALDDFKIEGTQTHIIRHFVSSADANYNSLAAVDLKVQVFDNDSAGIQLSKNAVSVGEDGTTDTYTVMLNAEPAAEVSITVTAASPVLVTVPGAKASSIGILNFGSSNWNIAQTVQVSVLPDLIQEGSRTRTLTHTSASTDGNYNHLTLNTVTVSVADVDHKENEDKDEDKDKDKNKDNKKDGDKDHGENEGNNEDESEYGTGSISHLLPPLSVSLGEDQLAHVQSTVSMKATVGNASGSVTYNWSLLSGAGSLSDTGGDTVLYRAPVNNTSAVIRVFVSDSAGRTASDDLEIDVWGEKEKSPKGK